MQGLKEKQGEYKDTRIEGKLGSIWRWKDLWKSREYMKIQGLKEKQGVYKDARIEGKLGSIWRCKD